MATSTKLWTTEGGGLNHCQIITFMQASMSPPSRRKLGFFGSNEIVLGKCLPVAYLRQLLVNKNKGNSKKNC